MSRTLIIFACALACAVGAPPCAAEVPAKVLDLSCWKLTLPVDTDHPGRPDEIIHPELNVFADPERFFVHDASDGVVFRAACGGAATKGSKYPRCELREMTSHGETEAAWGTDDGSTHTMTLALAITKTPAVKKHVVCAQIHDARDDVMMVRLEGKTLFIERNKVGDVDLDSDYALETPFDLKIQAGDGRIRVWYDDALKMDWQASRAGCYFKAGCYTQSNPDKGDAPDSCGEVVIRRLQIDHRKQP